MMQKCAMELDPRASTHLMSLTDVALSQKLTPISLEAIPWRLEADLSLGNALVPLFHEDDLSLSLSVSLVPIYPSRGNSSDSCDLVMGGSRVYDSGLREEGARNLMEAKGKDVLEVISVSLNDVCSLELEGQVDEVGSPLLLCTIIPQQ